MDYSFDSHSSKSYGNRHDSFLQPNSHDVYGYSRNSRSSTRLDVPSTSASMSRNKSVHERERRPYHHETEHRSRSSVRREETYPAFSRRAKSVRRRSSWPPPPSVEDEDEALAKEYPGKRRSKEGDDEVCMPGTLDQNPVFIELDNHERRFVVVPQDGAETQRPASSQSRRRSERPELKVNVEEPNQFARRQPSPYAFSATSPMPSNRDSTKLRTPVDASNSRNSFSSHTSRPKRDREPRPKNSNSSSDERQTDDSDLEPAAVARLRERKHKPRVSFTEPTSSPRSRPEVKRFSSDYTTPTESRMKPTASGSSTLKSAMKGPRSAPTSDDENPSRAATKTSHSTSRPMPIPIPIPQHVRAESMYSGRPSLDDFADQTSTSAGRAIPTPPGSPRLNDMPFSGNYYTSSKRPSHPSSPATPTFETRDFADNAPRTSNGISGGDRTNDGSYVPQSKPTSTLASHVRHASMERPASRRNDVKPPPLSVLPYPVDDPMIHMPNHEHYIDTPTTATTPFARASFGNLNVTESPITSPNILQRPTPSSRPRATSSVSDTSQKRTMSSSSLKVPASLPICPRMEYSKKYDDWYTLRDDQSIDICPTCLDEIVWPTPFRTEFVPAPPRAPTVRTRCDFASPWVRLAWLLTLKRQRRDLDLIYALAAISGVESSCPDAREGAGPWYGLLGSDGRFISDFAICSRDTKYIEACFPSLIGLFSRMPAGPSGKDAGMCSMRLTGKRFPTYLDLLEDIDEEARTVPLRSSSNLQQLIKVVRADSPKKKCTRDNLIRDSTWHFMPELPEFTVCEGCFDEAIWPTIKQGAEVASRFNKVLTPLPAGVAVDGASCQVYSPRMRKIWERTVKYGDKDGMIYLARKVRQRQEVENDLRRQQKEIARLLERSKKLGGSAAAADKERLKRELGKIEEDWASWE